MYNTDCLFRLRWTKSTRVLPLPFPGKMWHMLALNQVYFLNYQIKNILKNKKKSFSPTTKFAYKPTQNFHSSVQGAKLNLLNQKFLWLFKLFLLKNSKQQPFVLIKYFLLLDHNNTQLGFVRKECLDAGNLQYLYFLQISFFSSYTRGWNGFPIKNTLAYANNSFRNRQMNNWLFSYSCSWSCYSLESI